MQKGVYLKAADLCTQICSVGLHGLMEALLAGELLLGSGQLLLVLLESLLCGGVPAEHALLGCQDVLLGLPAHTLL